MFVAGGNNPSPVTDLREFRPLDIQAMVLVGISVLFVFCQLFKVIPDLYEIIFCSPKGFGGRCQMPAAMDICIRYNVYVYMCVCTQSHVHGGQQHLERESIHYIVN